MKKTQHIKSRCQQRGFKEYDLELVARYGTVTSDGLMLTVKNIANVEREMKRTMNRLSKLKDVFIPTDGATMITVYRVDRRRRRLQIGTW